MSGDKETVKFEVRAIFRTARTRGQLEIITLSYPCEALSIDE